MTSAVPALDRAARAGVSRPRRFRWTPGLVVGLALSASAVVIAVVSPLTLSDAANTLTNDPNLGPSPEHWLGTDSFGRDRLARSLVATQLTLLMTTAATLIAVLVGVVVGVGIWLAPRRVRELCLRALEIAVSYPGLLFAIVVAAILGSNGLSVVVAIGLAGIPTFARLSANLTAAVSRREFVLTARLMDVPSRLLMTRHILPNISEPLLILIASMFAVSLMEISGLSFVGIGVQAPQYDLGKLLADALPSLYTRPIEVVGPATMIVLIALGAMLIGDGLAAAADPRSTRLVAAARRPRRRGKPTPLTPTAGAPLVAVRDLEVTRADGRRLVHGISFDIRDGEILGVVGESGSGKSLSAMALAKLLPDGLSAHAEELRLGSMDLRNDVDPSELAHTVSLVYQDPGSTFNPALRMRGQLTEVLTTHLGATKREAESAVLEALRTVDIRDPERLLEQRAYELSGGMRQRAMIAASLAARPRLIIADEPTTALDVTVQAEILREFTRINRERSTSMLFISHDIAVVEALCDRAIVMRDGEIVETLDVADLRAGNVSADYTRSLLAATPRLEDRIPS